MKGLIKVALKLYKIRPINLKVADDSDCLANYTKCCYAVLLCCLLLPPMQTVILLNSIMLCVIGLIDVTLSVTAPI